MEQGGAPFDMDNLQTLCRKPCHENKTAMENRRRTARGERAEWIMYLEGLKSAANR
ncbi:MAG: hypothetical protein OXG25_02380 [Gammaproteobacteria bacterium]|nr:hypothetical protein [Gammaproteobacteria bacterium]